MKINRCYKKKAFLENRKNEEVFLRVKREIRKEEFMKRKKRRHGERDSRP